MHSTIGVYYQQMRNMYVMGFGVNIGLIFYFHRAHLPLMTINYLTAEKGIAN
jgi:hypothetical protein